MSRRAKVMITGIGWILCICFLAVVCIAIPSLFRARTTSSVNSCLNNLRQLDGAKQQWALEKQKNGDDIPSWSDIAPFVGRTNDIRCPQGGVYTLRRVKDAPKCSVRGHG